LVLWLPPVEAAGAGEAPEDEEDTAALEGAAPEDDDDEAVVCAAAELAPVVVAAGLAAVEQATAVGRSVTPKPLQSCAEGG